MAITINSFGDCGTNAKGSGITSCNKIDKGLLRGFGLVRRGWKKNILTDSLTETEYREAVKNMDIIPYTGLFNYEQPNEENVTETAPTTGAISVIRAGLPSFNFIFNNGDCQHKSLYDKQGNNNYDLILIFEKGIQLVKKGDNLQGYKTNAVQVSSYVEKGAESAKSTVMIQLASAEEYNVNSVFLSNADDLGFDPNDVNGVIETNLIIGTNTATTIPVTVKGACNSSYNILGLDDADGWTVTNTATGVEIEVTVSSTPTGYLLEGTGIPLTGITVTLLIEDTLGEIYKGKASK